MTKMLSAITAICAGLMLATAAAAQDEELGAAVSIELNAARTNEGSCTLSFLVLNGHGSQIDKAVYETVLFDAAGQVDRLTLFDFGTLPPGRPRVRQFTVPGMVCDGFSRILINGAHSCEAADLADAACEEGLTLKTRTKIEVIG